MTYLEDIIIFSDNESQHLEHLEIVFSHLREAGLKMKHSKCDFFKSKIHYLGQTGLHQTYACAESRERNQAVLRFNWLL